LRDFVDAASTLADVAVVERKGPWADAAEREAGRSGQADGEPPPPEGTSALWLMATKLNFLVLFLPAI
jgi:hypothetical protein